MLVLGVSGGLDPVYLNREFLFPKNTSHDSAAVLVADGEVVAAVEEERLNRIKHTSKAAVSAIRFCLDSYGVRLHDLDRLAVYGDEKHISQSVRMAYYRNLEEENVKDIRGLIHEMLIDEFDDDIEDEKLRFVEHHNAHAISAYAQSGYDKSLILTIDALGDTTSGIVMSAQHNSLDTLQHLPIQKSLGMYYLDVIRFLGYDLFDEYKVMGLAPYGNPAKYRPLFKSFYQLLPNGDYIINSEFPSALCKIGRQRRRGELFTQGHKDIAASLQESLEEIVFHMLRYYQRKTGHTRLCLAGGVAHNCTVNGKILYSGMFEEVFVQPAAHDAGCAIGAAFQAFFDNNSRGDGPKRPMRQLDSVYWGKDIGGGEEIIGVLKGWLELIEFEHCEDIAEKGAELLAQGAVIGWAQGRSEFGPRALGNRSILADPRPAENKDTINSMVKKREAYRPFAPAILEEYVDDFFDLPSKGMRFPFMTFVVKVREDKKTLMKATTHVDGTARLQTVSRATNERFWRLIDAFRKRTGVPALLNTSFNNNAEPIVDSAADAITCFLTTGLDYLIIYDYLIRKKELRRESYMSLAPSLPEHVRLTRTKRYASRNQMLTAYEIQNDYKTNYGAAISPEMFDLLSAADGQAPLGALLRNFDGLSQEGEAAIIAEISELWSKRLIIMSPVNRQTAG
jgi:carbamoyltransferase